MSEKIGVYVCECGPNIKDAMNFDEVVQFAETLENVAFSKSFGLYCSVDGQNMIAEDIKKENLTRVVFAGCSPREHETTFRNVLKRAGLNPYLLQIANIREQCAWVIKDKARATEVAKKLIEAAVKRVMLHEPL